VSVDCVYPPIWGAVCDFDRDVVCVFVMVCGCVIVIDRFISVAVGV